VQAGNSLLRDTDFMKFWVGQSVSVFGSQFSPLAIGTIAVLTLNATSLQLGILAFLNTVPFLALGLLVGVYVDRHRRRRMLILSDFGRSAVLFIIPLSAMIYVVTINVLYAVTFMAGILTVFFDITYQSYVPNLVDREKIIEANSLLETSRASAQTFGPGLAGLAITVISAPMAILGDTLGYLASAVSLTLIRRGETLDLNRKPASVSSEIGQGLSLVLREPRLRAIAGASGTANLIFSAYGAIQLKYFYQNLQMSVPEVGFAFSIGAAGGILGALTAIRVTRILGVGRTILLSSVVTGVVMILIYVATPSNAFYLVAMTMFITSVTVFWYNIPQLSYRQALVPTEIQGRMNATMRTITWGTLPLGGLLGGVVAELVGVHETIGIFTGLGMLTFLWIALSPVRGIKGFPTEEDRAGIRL
jgi:hypothetical protein